MAKVLILDHHCQVRDDVGNGREFKYFAFFSSAMTASEGVKELLMSNASTRIRHLRRLAITLVCTVLVHSGVYLWAAIQYEETANSTAMFGLFGIDCCLLVGLIVYLIFAIKNTRFSFSADIPDIRRQRAWHKRGYKVLACLTIFESALFFGGIPVLVLHSLGLSLRQCLSQSALLGIQYDVWVTVRSPNEFTRVQQLRLEQVFAQFSSTQVGLFGTFIGTLFVSITLAGLYWYSESTRRGSSGRISDYVVRRNILIGFACSTLTQLLVSMVGVFALSNIWFLVPIFFIILTGLVWLTLWSRKTSSEHPISRLQLRRVSSACFALMWASLYISGSGMVLACMNGVTFRAPTGELILPSTVVVQLVCMGVIHVVFTGISGVAAYAHLSVADILESVLVSSGIFEVGKSTTQVSAHEDPVVVDMGTTSCLNCHRETANVTYLPCGHTVTCRSCTEFLTTVPECNCPHCDRNVLDYVVNNP
jgi:hypothetical protein